MDHYSDINETDLSKREGRKQEKKHGPLTTPTVLQPKQQ